MQTLTRFLAMADRMIAAAAPAAAELTAAEIGKDAI